MCGVIDGFNRFIEIQFDTPMTLENMDEVMEIFSSLSDRFEIDCVHDSITVNLP